MLCNYIIIKGKNKNNNCKLKANYKLNEKTYCKRHYNLININKKENININNFKIKDFTIIKKIGNGTFGDVYKINHNITKEIYALKINNTKKDLLYYEYLLLSQHFIDNNYFPKLLEYPNISYKKEKNFIYLITEYFEETLKDRLNRYKLSEEQIKNYILQIINIIEFIHTKHYIYIDIKPENFMFKTINDNNIKIIDFGICEKYLDNKGIHKTDKKLTNSIGTDLYSSIRMMKAKQPGRIDDIECISYLLIYLYYGNLPWELLSQKQILKQKINIINDKIFNELPIYIKNFILLVKDYTKFDEKPNYNKFKSILQ